jgi:hypothetical protein
LLPSAFTFSSAPGSPLSPISAALLSAGVSEFCFFVSYMNPNKT